MIKVSKTTIDDLLIVEPKVFGDSRGYFFECYNSATFAKHGIVAQFVQDNQSYSKYGTIRGLHFQVNGHEQAKLVRAIYGRILDVAVDLRKNSPTFGHHYSIELNSDNQLQLFVPKGFAHGFSVLSDSAIVGYKCDALYSPENDRGLIYNDSSLAIDWKIPQSQQIISDKDLKHPTFRELYK